MIFNFPSRLTINDHAHGNGQSRLEAFLSALGNRVRGDGPIYQTGGATAVLHGWRRMAIGVHIKPDPEPPGLFEALVLLKDELDINVELASLDQFIPAVHGWRERSLFIAQPGRVIFPITAFTGRLCPNCNVGTTATCAMRVPCLHPA